jgi:hypothetical protein
MFCHIIEIRYSVYEYWGRLRVQLSTVFLGRLGVITELRKIKCCVRLVNIQEQNLNSIPLVYTPNFTLVGQVYKYVRFVDFTAATMKNDVF